MRSGNYILCGMMVLVLLSLSGVSASEFGVEIGTFESSEEFGVVMGETTTSSGNITNVNNFFNVSSNITHLNNLSDVLVPSPGDDEVLYYNDTTSSWMSKILSGFTNFWSRSGNTLTPATAGDNLDMTGGNITADEIHWDSARLVNLTTNGEINGSSVGIMMKGPTGTEAPHFILQTGGPDQGSVIVRSIIIANENVTILNSENRTSCQTWADEFGVRRRVDCNTTTTGADLFVGDDMQVGGTVSISDMDGGGTYYSVNDFFNIISSAGRISGGNITNPSGTNIVVKAGTGMLRILDDDISQVKFIDWAESGNINVPSDTIMYFGVEYNGGSPRVINTTNEADFDLDTDFPLGQAVNINGEIYALSNPWWTGDGLTNVIQRFEAFGHFSRDEEVGGLIPSETGTRNLALSSGRVWSRLTEHEISAFDSSGADVFDTYYRDGSGGFNEVADVSQWNNSHYDDGSGTLQPIANNQYAVMWIFLNVASKKPSIVYPQTTHPNTAAAEAEEVPVLPNFDGKAGFLIGRIVIQEGMDAPIEIQSAFVTQFTSAQASDHGNLGGLSDDDHVQYLLIDGTRAMTGDLSMGGFQLTEVGAIVMEGLISSYSIVPVTDNLYSLGNSTNKYKDIFVGDVNAENVNSNFANITNINSSIVNSNMITSNTVNSTELNSVDTTTTNLTIGGIGGTKVYVKDGVTFYRGVV